MNWKGEGKREAPSGDPAEEALVSLVGPAPLPLNETSPQDPEQGPH